MKEISPELFEEEAYDGSVTNHYISGDCVNGYLCGDGITNYQDFGFSDEDLKAFGAQIPRKSLDVCECCGR